MKIVGKILKYLLYGLVIFVFGLIFWRIWTINDESVLSCVTPTENALSAYAEKGADAFLSHEVHDRISGTAEGAADGYFSGYAFVYIPDKKEVQVTLRVNDSTAGRLGLSELPYFYLNIYENAEDVRNVREPIYTEDQHRLMYNYRRLVFEDVEIGEKNDLLICVSDTGDSSGDVSELVIHFQEQELEPYELTKNDVKSLEGTE